MDESTSAKTNSEKMLEIEPIQHPTNGLGGASMILSRKGLDGRGERVSLEVGVFDGAFGGDGKEDVVMGEGVVVASSSLERLTKSCLGGIMVSLIFLEGLEEEALVEAIEVRYEGDEDDKKNGEDEYLI
ncbi:hypothetical protein Tco_0446078 [Tanacetum coccineum]